MEEKIHKKIEKEVNKFLNKEDLSIEEIRLLCELESRLKFEREQKELQEKNKGQKEILKEALNVLYN